MQKAYESKYHNLENTNWWFVTRRQILLQIVERLNIKKDAEILEVGCSGGPLIKLLNQHGHQNIKGIDISEEAIQICNSRGISNVFVMDGTKTSFEDNQFDIVISSDTLEHIEKDEQALKEWNRILKPGGQLVVFVPAFEFLWCSHDDINQHFRRYTKNSLVTKLLRSGFEIHKSSYWNFALFFPTSIIRLVQKFIEKRSQKQSDNLLDLNPILNNILILLVSVENYLIKYLYFPVGVSVFAIAKKK